MREYDVDVVIIGSGFGGSVAALRLAEKGYRVRVLEAGRRFADEELPRTSWDVRRFLWAPKLRCFGIQRIHLLRDVVVLAGAGVGGGSLNYACTLYVPPEPFFGDRQWGHITDWHAELAPHYETASRMLGVTTNPCDGPVEEVMRATARDLGVQDTVFSTPVGVYFGEPARTVADPYFGGAGPARTGCTQCGNCMVGCRVGAKNTLVKNYLALAERLGVRIDPLRTVTRVRPLDAAHPDQGYAVTSEATGSLLRRRPETLRARQVILAAGAFNTGQLLHRWKATGDLPNLSPATGLLTRTNSEQLSAAMTLDLPAEDLSRGVAITTSFHVSADTHVENCRYGAGSNLMGAMMAVFTDSAGRRSRLLSAARELVRNPITQVRAMSLHRWSQRTIIALIMQSRDNSLTTSYRRGLFGGHRMSSRQGHGEPNPTTIPEGVRATRVLAARLAERTGRNAMPRGSIGELFDVPMTAHYLGGAVISDDPSTGVVDPYQRVWGYPGITIADGAAISANLGVNPALTITAQAERAMSLWPRPGEPDTRPAQGARYTRLEPTLDGIGQSDAAYTPQVPSMETS
ncbi:GMC family oxidoreductase N-terminal domain-containing protein [Gephyromycinifex aptenodytis]|uniref:GMC family oxidoreductase N-terminal domain-containing protein n=1 Tax=Gephyromycinifex aptenodytis TaxID=2716227 RepID=UPI0014480D76|nr:GMC family oxidoreductase [Gephyromycinifex aptenodytis]